MGLELLQRDPSQSLVMLEARTACSGATGRNGAHTKPASYRSFPRNVETLGEAEAARIVRFEYKTMKAVHAFAKEHSIECDRYLGETVDIIYDLRQLESAKHAVKSLKDVLGEQDPAAKYQFFDPEETEKRFATPHACGSVLYEAGSLSAYRFVIGILEMAIKRGLKLYTNTPAMSLERHGQGWEVKTGRGTIRADRVVLATNGYTAALYPKLQGVIVPLRGQVTSQRRGSKMPPADPPLTYSFIQTDGYEYMVQRPMGSQFGGDIVIGGGLTAGDDRGLYEYGTVLDSELAHDVGKYLRDCTPRYFGPNWGKDHPEGRVRTEWSGIMGYSPDGLPFIGPIPGENELFIAASFQGHGMVLSFLSARSLASMMHGSEEQVDEVFPSSFLVTEERLRRKFAGRLNLKPHEKEARHIG